MSESKTLHTPEVLAKNLLRFDTSPPTDVTGRHTKYLLTSINALTTVIKLRQKDPPADDAKSLAKIKDDWFTYLDGHLSESAARFLVSLNIAQFGDVVKQSDGCYRTIFTNDNRECSPINRIIQSIRVFRESDDGRRRVNDFLDSVALMVLSDSFPVAWRGDRIFCDKFVADAVALTPL